MPYRERLPPVEGHPSAALLRAPLVLLPVVPDHRVLVKTRIIVQSDSRGMVQVHVEPASDRKQQQVVNGGPRPFQKALQTFQELKTVQET